MNLLHRDMFGAHALKWHELEEFDDTHPDLGHEEACQHCVESGKICLRCWLSLLAFGQRHTTNPYGKYLDQKGGLQPQGLTEVALRRTSSTISTPPELIDDESGSSTVDEEVYFDTEQDIVQQTQSPDGRWVDEQDAPDSYQTSSSQAYLDWLWSVHAHPGRPQYMEEVWARRSAKVQLHPPLKVPDGNFPLVYASCWSAGGICPDQDELSYQRPSAQIWPAILDWARLTYDNCLAVSRQHAEQDQQELPEREDVD